MRAEMEKEASDNYYIHAIYIEDSSNTYSDDYYLRISPDVAE